VLGALVAARVDGRPATAFFAGVAAVYVGREMLKPLIRTALDRSGLGVQFDRPGVPVQSDGVLDGVVVRAAP
jgi:hypothetical protein